MMNLEARHCYTGFIKHISYVSFDNVYSNINVFYRRLKYFLYFGCLTRVTVNLFLVKDSEFGCQNMRYLLAESYLENFF